MDERSLSSRSSILESEAAPESYLFFFSPLSFLFTNDLSFPSHPLFLPPFLPPIPDWSVPVLFVIEFFKSLGRRKFWVYTRRSFRFRFRRRRWPLGVCFLFGFCLRFSLPFRFRLFAFSESVGPRFYFGVGGDSLGFSGILGILRDSLDLIQDSSRRIQKPSKQKHQKTHQKERQQQHKFSEIHWRFLTPFCGFLEYSPSNIHRDSFPRRWFWDA